MRYTSTRNNNILISASEAIVSGMDENGGLFIPTDFPRYSYADLSEMKYLNYAEKAKKIVKDFLTDFTEEELNDILNIAYASDRFDENKVAPIYLEQNGQRNMYVLELWHGPTSAFKDVALQLFPYLVEKSINNVYGSDRKCLVLVATSGDTGKAAMEAFRDVPNTEILVFYPKNGISRMQEMQMRTQEGSNVKVLAVDGNFDIAQKSVKSALTSQIMQQEAKENNVVLTSANSINLGRLIPQIVYYFSAYCDLMKSGEIDYEGEKVNIVVPSGNFGNILAAYYAKQMGLPVNKLICASNENNVLTDFFRTGVYDANREFVKTISPSMDILISSNLERLLYHIMNKNSDKVKSLMDALRINKKYAVGEDTRKKLSRGFYAGFCDDERILKTIKNMYDTENYLCDPHTSVAINVYDQYVKETGDNNTPTIIVSTASPYKFSESVLAALDNDTSTVGEFDAIEELSAISGIEVPRNITNLRNKSIRFSKVCRPEEINDIINDSINL